MALWSVQALAAGYWVLAYQYADNDTGLAVRIARECLEHGACPAAGTPTSGFGLSHGASWIRVIAYCLASGAGLGTVQLIGLAFLLAATIVWSIVAWRALSWRAGMFAALLALPATMATLRYDDLTNGVLAPLPLALYYACTASFVHARRVPAALAASVFLAATVSAALGFIVLVPLHVALVALTTRTPVVAASGAALAVAALFAIESSMAALQIARLVAWPSAVIAGVLVVIGAAAAVAPSARTRLGRIGAPVRRWRRRFADLPAPIRLRVAMKLAATYLIAVPWIAAAGRLQMPAAHYFAAAVPPFVFLAADATAALSDRFVATSIGVLVLAVVALPFAPLATALGSVYCTLAAGAAFLVMVLHLIRSGAHPGSDLETRPSAGVAVAGVLLACLASLPDAGLYPRARQVWAVTTAETMVRKLYAAGFTFPQLMRALQGQAPYTIQSMVASLDPALLHDTPPPDASTPDASTPSLIAIIVDPAIAARTRDVVARVDTPDRRAALVVRAASVLDRSRLRTCYAHSCDEQIDPERCITRNPEATVQHDRPYFPVDKREMPAPGALPSYQPPGRTYCIRFFVPLRMSGSAEPHWLRVSQIWPFRIRISQVSGVAFDGTVPGAEVRLTNDRPGSGTLEVEVSAHGVGPDSDWLEEPPVLEVTPAHEQLLEPFRRGRVTLR